VICSAVATSGTMCIRCVPFEHDVVQVIEAEGAAVSDGHRHDLREGSASDCGITWQTHVGNNGREFQLQ
jgi:hypothetical protein